MDDKTPWTSIDLYYKGFHIKKSWPENVSRVVLMSEVDDLIKAGFKPSWNEDTNKVQAPVVAPVVQNSVDTDLSSICPIHNVPMTQKDGKFGPFWSHKKPDGVWCNGRKTNYNK